jgi:hypothetical protein
MKTFDIENQFLKVKINNVKNDLNEKQVQKVMNDYIL